jgi:DNA polymerase-3 subunit delta'
VKIAKTNADAILPWFVEKWSALHDQSGRDRLPHAILLAGAPGTGKKDFAHSLAALLLCEQPGNVACGHCRACQLVAAGTHPDLVKLSPEEKSRQIKIDQVRELLALATQTAQQGGRRVVVINPAGAMNKHAANSLLKVLEEPGTDTFFILVNQGMAGILPTIRSRCQVHVLPAPTHQQGINWLAERLPACTGEPAQLLAAADGQPLTALQMAEEGLLGKRDEVCASLQDLGSGQSGPVEVAAGLIDAGAPRVLGWLASWLRDVIRWKHAGNETVLQDDSLLGWYRQLAQSASLREIHNLFDEIQLALWQSTSTMNPNEQLLLESVLVRWQRCFGGRAEGVSGRQIIGGQAS